MRFPDANALAQEYRKRGWKHIAQYIETAESYPVDVELTIAVPTDYGDEKEVTISDPYAFFAKVMNERDRQGTIADASLSFLNEWCEDAIAVFDRPHPSRLN